MNTMNQVKELFGEKRIMDGVIQILSIQLEDFPAIHHAYTEAINELRAELGEEEWLSLQRYVSALEQQCISNLIFAGVQGCKMNLEHFINPMTPNCTWEQVDFDDFLRYDLAFSLPMYKTAEIYIEAFYKKVPTEMQDIFEPIISYKSVLEVSGMKLAHYFGYLLGNQLFYRSIPGYHSDAMLDLRYRCLLEDYFGCKLCVNRLCDLLERFQERI
ncbi:MAG: hypothetical protein IKA47_10265 [Oscillospiraceae bacterium]|nr:hypothetical protein [Oscillospiraceae bacterium]MBR2310895.1 hypothetical protein [Oscillospiraceae bacterium]